MLQAVASAISIAVSAAEVVGAIAILCALVSQHVETILNIVHRIGGKK